MATFNHISGAEPSTITFKLATVTQTRNSSAMHQEIMALGDPDTSNAIAAVLNAVPASTAWGLVVRLVGNSSIQGNSTVAPLAGSTWATRPIQSSAADLQMTATQGTSPWVVAGASTVAPLAGSTWATRPIQSSAADLQMTATPAAGSTWRTQPGSTAWASSAGFHFDSSGALQIAGSITATAGSTVSTGFISVRISDGSTWVTDYLQASTFTSTNVAGGVNFLRVGQSSVSSTDTFVMPWGSTAGAQVMANADSSGAIVLAGDSANNALRVNVVAGAAGGSTIVTVSTGSVRVHQSTAADLNVTISGNSTSIQGTSPWIVAGNCTVAPLAGSTWAVRPIQSSAADLQVTATQGTNPWTIAGNSTVMIGTNLQSSAAPSSNSSGLIVRQVVDNILTAVSTSALATTSVEFVSSGASLRTYVVAYSLTSTNQTPAHWGFFSSNGTQLWALTLAALSSGVAGANLAVGAPAYLFRTAASEALNFKTAGSTVAGVQGSVSYFRAP